MLASTELINHSYRDHYRQRQWDRNRRYCSISIIIILFPVIACRGFGLSSPAARLVGKPSRSIIRSNIEITATTRSQISVDIQRKCNLEIGLHQVGPLGPLNSAALFGKYKTRAISSALHSAHDESHSDRSNDEDDQGDEIQNDDDDYDFDDDEDDDDTKSLSSKSTYKDITSTKQNSRQRPPWALPWMPTYLLTLRPITQLLVGLALYILHLRVLTQYMIPFPFQLIPNEEGWFQSIGLDSLAGMISFFGLIWLRKASVKHVSSSLSGRKKNGGVGTIPVPAVPPIWTDPTEDEAPWRLRKPKTKKKTKKPAASSSKKAKTLKQVYDYHPRPTSIVAFFLLTFAYFSTGRFSLLFENLLYAAAGYGLPLTVAMHRSLVVLLGHWMWVLIGSGILAGVLSPKPFFGGGWMRVSADASGDDGNKKAIKSDKAQRKKKVLRPYRWYTNQWDTYWLWWTIGGYFVSAWCFNIADFLNQIVLPSHLFATSPEGVVSQLINPENNDFLASLVGYIAPCLSAPWWEEVLYRGYLLPALGLFMGFWPSVFVSGVLFSVHHLSVMGAIPLAVLGWVWAFLYAKSGNILVTILIHGMWNSRVFLGSWLGL